MLYLDYFNLLYFQKESFVKKKEIRKAEISFFALLNKGLWRKRHILTNKI